MNAREKIWVSSVISIFTVSLIIILSVQTTVLDVFSISEIKSCLLVSDQGSTSDEVELKQTEISDLTSILNEVDITFSGAYDSIPLDNETTTAYRLYLEEIDGDICALIFANHYFYINGTRYRIAESDIPRIEFFITSVFD